MPLDAELKPPKIDTTPHAVFNALQQDASQSDDAELMDAGLLPEHKTSELPSASDSDAGEASVDKPDPSSSSRSSPMDDSRENDVDDEDIGIDTNTEDTHGKQDIDMEMNTEDTHGKQDIDMETNTEDTHGKQDIDMENQHANDDNVSSDMEASDKQEHPAKNNVNIDADQGYVSDDSDVLVVSVTVPDKPCPSITCKVYRS